MNKKYIIFLIIGTLINTTCALSQIYNFVNIIKNHSFEDGIDNSKPDNIAQAGFLQFWSDNLTTKSESNMIYYLHSPEWFKDSYGYINMVEYNQAHQPIHINANSGVGYIGMGFGELIQQKLSNNLKFNEGITYYLSLYIRPIVYPVYSYYGYFGYSSWSNYVNLKVYAAKKEIQYKNNKTDDLCTQEYGVLSDGIFQDILTIANFPISLNDYDQGVWHKIETNFIAPNDNYDWIAIELSEFPAFCDAYILIDDIVIAEGCINGCSSTAGTFNISTNGSHSATVPFTVFGLKNISHVKLEIITSIGQQIIRTIEISNPPDKIAWNGKNGSGGEVSAAHYTYKITATNDCGEKIIAGIFSKVNASVVLTIDDYEYYNYNSVYKPPIPSCEDDIIIQNKNLVQDKTIGASNPLLLKVENSILAGPNIVVQTGNNVVFEAGNLIDLQPGFTVEPQASFDAIIIPCNQVSNRNLQVGASNFNFESQFSDDMFELLEFEINNTHNCFNVHPNPFNNSFNIELNQEQKSVVNIYLTNNLGRKVLQFYSGELEKGEHLFEVKDISLPPGFYLCVYETPTLKEVNKIIKIE